MVYVRLVDEMSETECMLLLYYLVGWMGGDEKFEEGLKRGLKHVERLQGLRPSGSDMPT